MADRPNRTPNGIRTRVTCVKGRRPRPLDDGGRTSLRAGSHYQRPKGTRHSSDAAPADVPGLVKAVDECAAERKAADVTVAAPAAKRPRLVEA